MDLSLRFNYPADVCHSFKIEKKAILLVVKSFLLLYLLTEYSFLQLISKKPFVNWRMAFNF